MELLEPFEMPQKDAGIADLLVKVGEAVAVLHALGYVHRDIKPANIMYRRKNDGGVEPVLIDLGLLKRRTESENIKADLSVTLVDGEALGAPQYIWQTSEDMPWRVKKSPEYEGGAAVLASGGGGGVVETYLKTRVTGGARRMTFKFQRAYYKGTFSVEVDGRTVFSDTSISRDEGDRWNVESVLIPKGSHEVKFKYRHSGSGYRNEYNGVRLDTVSFATL